MATPNKRMALVCAGLAFCNVLLAAAAQTQGVSQRLKPDKPNTMKPNAPGPAGLTGFVDLHTHPVANVGFGGKLIYGGVGIGALLPSDPDCVPRVPATTEAQALGHDRAVHGGHDFLNNTCGDELRKFFIGKLQVKLKASNPPEDAFGFPTFQHWPVWNDITHQKMWVEWLRRAVTGGLRVLVALAVNNKTIGDMVAGDGDLPTDDKSSVDLQIDEIKKFANANSDFMEIALNSDDVQRIVSASKLAVVIGVEVDHIGNLQTATWAMGMPIMTVPTAADLKAEVHRLFDAGVRYIFPIHLLDNAFGGTAAYEDAFNVSNSRESGSPWKLKCADPADGIDYTYSTEGLENLFSMLKLGMSFFPSAGPDCRLPTGQPLGQRNSLGLAANGNGAAGIHEMMRLGMLIDIDHMSQDAANQTLKLAEAVPGGGYPLNSGHNGLRGAVPDKPKTERDLTAAQYKRIGALHGMAGVGGAGLDAWAWLQIYNQVTAAMGPGAVAGFGTDTNGLALGMRPRQGPQTGVKVTPDPRNEICRADCDCEPTAVGGRNPACAPCVSQCDKSYPPSKQTVCVARCSDPPGSNVQYTNAFPASMDGSKTWNYNTHGVAHYGMLPDFLMDVETLPGGPAAVANLRSGAEYFFQTWRKAERLKRSIPCDVGPANVPCTGRASYNGDSYTDALIYNTLTGGTEIRYGQAADGLRFAPQSQGTWSLGHKLVPGDYNGDGYTDLLIYNTRTGGTEIRYGQAADGLRFAPQSQTTWSLGHMLISGPDPSF